MPGVVSPDSALVTSVDDLSGKTLVPVYGYAADPGKCRHLACLAHRLVGTASFLLFYRAGK